CEKSADYTADQVDRRFRAASPKPRKTPAQKSDSQRRPLRLVPVVSTSDSLKRAGQSASDPIRGVKASQTQNREKSRLQVFFVFAGGAALLSDAAGVLP